MNLQDMITEALPYKWQQDLITAKLSDTELAKPLNVFAVDGDILAYRTAAVCEEEFEGSCNAIIDATLRKMVEETGVQLFRIYLSGSDNFRFKVAKTKPYKGNRDTFVAPRFLSHCKNYLRSKYNAITIDLAEADDGIASDMMQNGAIHCGIDKDILQIPGRHYNWTTNTWTTVGEEMAIVTLYRQVLMGDTSDNIPGLPRIGEKKAAAAIESAETAADDCLQMYKEVCAAKLPDVNPFEYMAEQLQLVKMLTDLELDISKTVYINGSTDGFTVSDGDFTGFEDEYQEPEQLEIKL